MEPMMNTHNFQFGYAAKRIALGLGLAVLTSCSSLPNEGAYQPDAGATSSEAETASEFTFPQTNCGEAASQPSGTWYVVFKDGANPDEVRREYCRDAIGTVRDGSGVPTVQVASFTDYDKALRFAAAVGGEVEATTYDNQSTSATATPTPSTTSSPGSLIGNTAYLSAKETGSTINVRENPSTSAPVRHMGRAGDAVKVADRMQGDDGFTWYKVAFESGQQGWVRSDFISDGLANSGQSSSGASPYSSYDPNSYSSGSQSYSSSTDRYSSNSQSTTSNSYSSGGQGYSADRYSSNGQSSSSNSYASPSSGSSSSDSGNYSSNYSGDSTSSGSSYTSSDSYSQAEVAIPDPGDEAVLAATDPGARINIRDDASTSAQIRHTGYAGDPVQITDVMQGDDGYTWYNVEFDSGVTGWVRGDYVDGQ